MMAVILAGGRGTRLQPHTVTVPEPLRATLDLHDLVAVVAGLLRGSGTPRGRRPSTTGWERCAS
jgi:hypothetical protein